MSEVLKTTPRFGDLLGGFMDSACSSGYDLLQTKDTKPSQHKGKVHGVNTRGNQAQTSKSPLPVESHGTCLISAAMSYDNT